MVVRWTFWGKRRRGDWSVVGLDSTLTLSGLLLDSVSMFMLLYN